MRLFTFRNSPNPLKVRLALDELELDYETVEINLFKGEHRQPSFLNVNPAGKVPVLTDGDFFLRESNAILSYLGSEYGGPLWPQNPEETAKALEWLFFEASHLNSNCGNWWWNEVVVPKIEKPELAVAKEVLEEGAKDLHRHLGIVEKHFSTNAYALGEEFTLVDCCLAPTISLLQPTKFPALNDFPQTLDYCKRIQSRDSWKKTNAEAIYGR